ncbi:amidase-like isoform X3 [Branchiostoma floridae]|uniref:Amidase-like isoform X3 n=1 Tax=Branchiostoma floridae TaxID=7739 RepID=A0A9J7L7W3_BRAFL|nr:amidase-like isoform X3 [Branchiostoma floridae]
MQGGAASTASALYSPSAVRTPSLQQLSQSAAKFNLDIDEAELKQYQDVIKEALVSYDRVDKMTEPIPAVKWPRTPGWRPDPEDNPHNAWYFRTEITGASTGKLHGKTVAIKDNVAVAGVPMMNGSRIMEGYVPDYDATIVTRILDAGGSIKGKSSCEDLCLSGDSFTSVTGPVLNAHDRTRSAGGSSSGSATLLALEQVDMATGGDQGGSIRIPAAWSGVVGLKPTYGLVPYTGCVPVDITLDHVGPMARTVDDVALMLEVIAGYDNGLDPRQPANLTVPEYTKQLTGDLGGIRVGLLKEGFGTSHIYNVINEGCLETMIKGNGLGVGWKGFYPTSMLDALAKGYRTRAHDMPPTGKFTYLLYDCITTNYGNRFYAKGQNLSRMLTHAYNQALSRYDVIIMPTIPFKATKLPNKDISTSEICKMALNFGQMSNVCPFNLTGHPALSINAGFSQGLPVGMMIVGRHFDDATVLKVAHAFENIRDSKI